MPSQTLKNEQNYKFSIDFKKDHRGNALYTLLCGVIIMEKEFKGHCKGVKLTKRGENDNHICLQILTKDDENWFASENPFSSYWIDDLIEQLKITKHILKHKNQICMKVGNMVGSFVNAT